MLELHTLRLLSIYQTAPSQHTLIDAVAALCCQLVTLKQLALGFKKIDSDAHDDCSSKVALLHGLCR